MTSRDRNDIVTSLETAEQLDGRTARRDRNRDIVLDATIELFAEGMLMPGAIEVAERSGVSLRSVYRYFEDMDELVRSAIVRHQEHSRDLYRLDDLGVGSVEDRVERIVDQRLAMHTQLAPMIRATLAHVHHSEILRTRLEVARGLLADQVAQMFGPELLELPLRTDKEVAAALDMVLGFESIEHLRVIRRLSVAETRRTLIRTVDAILQHAP